MILGLFGKFVGCLLFIVLEGFVLVVEYLLWWMLFVVDGSMIVFNVLGMGLKWL